MFTSIIDFQENIQLITGYESQRPFIHKSDLNE